MKESVMYPHFIEVHAKDDKVPLSINIDNIIGFGSNGEYAVLRMADNSRWFVYESYEELKKLIFDAGCIIARKDPRLEDRPLTKDDLMTMIEQPVFNSNTGKWNIVFDYTKGEEGDFVSLMDPMGDIYYLHERELPKYPLYRMRIN